MKTLKEYIQNHARLEGFIAEGYVVSETLMFCSKYLKGVETRFNKVERNPYLTEYSGRDKLFVFSSAAQPIKKVSIVRLEEKQRRVA